MLVKDKRSSLLASVTKKKKFLRKDTYKKSQDNTSNLGLSYKTFYSCN